MVKCYHIYCDHYIFAFFQALDGCSPQRRRSHQRQQDIPEDTGAVDCRFPRMPGVKGQRHIPRAAPVPFQSAVRQHGSVHPGASQPGEIGDGFSYTTIWDQYIFLCFLSHFWSVKTLKGVAHRTRSALKFEHIVFYVCTHTGGVIRRLSAAPSNDSGRCSNSCIVLY